MIENSIKESLKKAARGSVTLPKIKLPKQITEDKITKIIFQLTDALATNTLDLCEEFIERGDAAGIGSDREFIQKFSDFKVEALRLELLKKLLGVNDQQDLYEQLDFDPEIYWIAAINYFKFRGKNLMNRVTKETQEFSTLLLNQIFQGKVRCFNDVDEWREKVRACENEVKNLMKKYKQKVSKEAEKKKEKMLRGSGGSMVRRKKETVVDSNSNSGGVEEVQGVVGGSGEGEGLRNSSSFRVLEQTQGSKFEKLGDITERSEEQDTEELENSQQGNIMLLKKE